MRTRELPIRSIDLTKDVMPLSEFRSTIADCFARTRRTHRPILVTQNGRSASVVIDVADFQKMRETIELIDDVRAAEEEIERGEEISQNEFERELLAEGTFVTAVRQIKWTKRGQKRFREQQDYITNDNCRQVALEWGRRVIDATHKLDRFPLSGRIVPEIGRPEIRELIIDGHFRIIYKARRDFCDILSIRHTAFLIKSIRSL